MDLEFTPKQAISFLKERGYTNTSIAAAVGCHRVTISRLSLGKHRAGGLLQKALNALARDVAHRERLSKAAREREARKRKRRVVC